MMKKLFLNKTAKLKDSQTYTTRILLVFAGLFTIVLMLIWNISKMNNTLRKSTEQYVIDAMDQLASDISFRLDIDAMYVEQLANSIEKMPSYLITSDFLEKKAASLEFDSLLIIDRDGNKIPEDFVCEDLDEWLAQGETLYEESRISYIGGQNILFSTPIKKAGEEERILIGVYENDKIQDLLQLAGFGGKSTSCIADRSGRRIVSPVDSSVFKQIRNLLKESEDSDGTVSPMVEADYSEVNQMKKDIQSGKSGLIYINSIQETPMIVSYHMLGTSDWVLFTTIPQNLLIAESETYMQWTSIIIVGISVILIFILLYVISNYRKNQKYLEKIAFTDPLTGGPNNISFQIRCKEVMEEDPQGGYTIVFLNIRGFKHINENFGVEEGNKTLKYIYKVLLSHMGKRECVTRSEVDHFFLLLCETEEEKIRRRLEDILSGINLFGEQENVHYPLNIVQGVYVIDNKELDIRIIQDRARVAAGYQTENSSCIFYNYNLTEKMNKEMKLNALFEESIENGDFQMYLQPKVFLKENTICGAEALVRWIHPEYGVIYPSDFIPLFERNRKICRLDIYMFEEVCKRLQRWMQEGRTLIPVSVNLSRRNIGVWNFLQRYIEIKEKYQIPDNLIEFELTESLFFDTQQVELVKQMIQQMHEHGFLCSLDDFGFGYSSLALLKEVDVDTIKLDRQFFVGDSDKMWKVVSNLISLAKELGIHVVAEGIETKEQLDCLRERDCDMVQGYIYSKPLPVIDFLDWMDSYEGTKKR